MTIQDGLGNFEDHDAVSLTELGAGSQWPVGMWDKEGTGGMGNVLETAMS